MNGMSLDEVVALMPVSGLGVAWAILTWPVRLIGCLLRKEAGRD